MKRKRNTHKWFRAAFSGLLAVTLIAPHMTISAFASEVGNNKYSIAINNCRL